MICELMQSEMSDLHRRNAFDYYCDCRVCTEDLVFGDLFVYNNFRKIMSNLLDDMSGMSGA